MESNSAVELIGAGAAESVDRSWSQRSMRATMPVCIAEVGSEVGFRMCKNLRRFQFKRDYSEE